MAKRLNKQMVLGLTIALMVLTTAACVWLIANLPQKDPKPLVADAERFAAGENYEEATKAYGQAARRARAAKDAVSANAYLVKAGEMALKAGLARDALQCWQSVLLNNPKHEQAQEHVVKLQLEMASYGGGAGWARLEGEAKKLVDINPNNYLGQYALGRALIEQRAVTPSNAQEGEKKLIAARDGDKANAEYAGALAQFYVSNGQYAEAERVYNVLVEDNPSLDKDKLAEAYVERGQFRLQQVGRVHAELAGAPPAQAPKLRGELQKLESQALADLEKAVQVAPQNAKALAGLGRFWHYRQQLGTTTQQAVPKDYRDRARRYYEEAIAAAPDDFEVYQRLAQLYTTELEYDKALKVINARIERGYNRKHYLAEIDAYRMNNLREDAFKINLTRLQQASGGQLERPEAEKRRQEIINELTELYNQTVAGTTAGEADPRALFMKARLLMIEGNYNGAIAKLEEAQKLFVTVPPEVRQMLAGLYLQTGSYGPAKEVLTALLQQVPDYPPALFMLARAHLQSYDPANPEYRNELDKAEGMLKEVLKRDAGNREALRLLGGIYRVKGNEAAFREIDKQLTEGVDPVQLKLREASLLRSQANEDPDALDRARVILQDILQKDPLNPVAFQMVSQVLYELHAKADEKTKAGYAAEIEKLVANSRAAVQKKLAEVSTATQPAVDAERYQAFAASIDRLAVVLDPKSSEEEKVKRFEELLRKGDDPYVVSSQLFDLYRRLPARQKDAAEQAAKLVAMPDLKPDQAGILDVVFQFALQQKDWTLAEACVSAVARTGVDPSGGHFYRGRLLLGRSEENPEDAKRARDEIRLGLSVFPRSVTGQVWLGQANLMLKQYDEAIQVFEEARRLDPRSAMAAVGLAMAARAKGDQAAFDKYLASCAQLAPQNPWVRDKLVEKQEREDPKKGIVAREARRKEDPKDVGNLVMLADLYIRDGQVENAMKAYEDALKLKPTDLVIVQRYANFLSSKTPPDDARAEKILQDLSKAIDPAKLYEKAMAQLLIAAQTANVAGRAGANIPQERRKVIDAAFTEATKISDHPEVLLNVADYFLRTNRTDEALKWHREALNAVIKSGKVGDQGPIRTRIVDALLGTRDPRRAEEVRKEIAAYHDLFPDDPTPDMMEGRLRAMLGDGPGAIESFTRFVKNAPTLPLGFAMRGQTYFAGSQWDKAIEDLLEVKRIDPQYQGFQGRVLLARAYQNAGQTDSAIQELQSILTEAPDQRQAVDDLLNLYVQANRLAAADSLLAQRAEAEPKNPVWSELRARVAQERKQPDAAVAHSREAVQKSGYEPSRVVLLCSNLIELERFDDLLSFVNNELPREQRKRSLILSMMGVAHAGKKDVQKSLDTFVEALEADPPEFDAFGNLFASAVMRYLNLEEATELLRKRLQTKPSDPAAKLLLLMIERKGTDKKDFAKALREYIAGVSKEVPQQKRLWLFALEQLAMLEHIETKNLEEARKLYEQILETEPQNFKVLNNLAYLLMEELGDPKAALPYAEQAVKLAPSNPGILDTVGWNHVHLKDYDRAIVWLQQAAQADPRMAAAHLHLARAYFERGSAPGAKNKTADLDAAKTEVFRAHQLIGEQLARTGRDPDSILSQAVQLGDKLGLKLSGAPASAPAR